MSKPSDTENIAAHVARSFAAQSMMGTLDATLQQAKGGRSEITAPIGPGVRQQAGYGHAGLTFSIGDSAAGYAALSLLQADEEVLTTEMKINLVAPAKGDYLCAQGRVEKAGRRLMVVTARVAAVTGDEETLVALLQGTMLPLRP